jgi:hypothetical protein
MLAFLSHREGIITSQKSGRVVHTHTQPDTRSHALAHDITVLTRVCVKGAKSHTSTMFISGLQGKEGVVRHFRHIKSMYI